MVGTDGNPADLIPVAGAGLKLMVGKEGHGLRQRLLLALVRDGRLHTDDIQALATLVRRRFSPARLAGDWWQQLSL